MKVLFIYRVYGTDQKNPVVQNQLNSLSRSGIEILEFRIKKGGVKYYLISIMRLIAFSFRNKYDIIHAHYSYSGILAILGSTKPVVCSLMGSDILQTGCVKKKIIGALSKYFWSKTIVKSKNMMISGAAVIPNGVDIENFRPIDKLFAIEKVRFNKNDINILFIATDLNSEVKNFALAEKSVLQLGNSFKLHALSDVSFNLLPYYYSAADLLLLTSKSEGSPNVIKEAMACNCPIVSTNVGDVFELNKKNPHCKIVNPTVSDITNGIKMVLQEKERKNSRELVMNLSKENISKQILTIYQNVLIK